MRLYLSSQNLGNDPSLLANMLNSNKRAAIIANAADYHTEHERKERVARELVGLSEAGIDGEELDLRQYFGRPGELKQKLSEYGLVWVRGGNVFILQRAFKQSGFSKIIKELLAEDTIIYAGYSAGACAASNTLQGLQLVDEPETVPEGYEPEILWGGLELIDYSIAPHYKSEHTESKAVDNVIDYFEEHGMPYRALSDGEVIIVDE